MKRMPPAEIGGLESIASPEAPATGYADRAHFPLVESVRAMAALAVVLIHTSFVSGAVFLSSFKGLLAHLNIGVTVFFLISAFLLYRPYVAAAAQGLRPPKWRRYARRRFLRIAPAYWLALTVLSIGPGLFAVFTGDWWVYYGLLQPYPIYHPVAACARELLNCGIAPMEPWAGCRRPARTTFQPSSVSAPLGSSAVFWAIASSPGSGRSRTGIFLWHFPIMFYVADAGGADWLPGNPFISLSAATLLVALPLAAMSFYLVERPLMRWSRRTSA